MNLSKKLIGIALLSFCITGTSYAQNTSKKVRFKENNRSASVKKIRPVEKKATNKKAMEVRKLKPLKTANKKRTITSSTTIQGKSHVLKQKQLKGKKATNLKKQSQPLFREFQGKIVD